MRLAWLLVAAGCTTSGPTEVYATSCVRSIEGAAGALVVHGACGNLGHVDDVVWTGTQLESVVGYGDTNLVYDRTRVLPTMPPTFIGRTDAGYDAWPIALQELIDREPGTLTDVSVQDGALVVARHGAIVAGTSDAFPALGSERTLLADRPFESVAVTGQSIVYAAAAQQDAHTTEPGVELGIASDHGGTYLVDETVHDEAAPLLPLVTADLDGDGTLDVIGGATHLIVRESTTAHFAVLPPHPLAIAKDLFLAPDGVYRIAGDLSTEKILDERADLLAVTDLDGNGVDDIVLADTLGSEVRVYRR